MIENVMETIGEFATEINLTSWLPYAGWALIATFFLVRRLTKIFGGGTVAMGQTGGLLQSALANANLWRWGTKGGVPTGESIVCASTDKGTDRIVANLKTGNFLIGEDKLNSQLTRRELRALNRLRDTVVSKLREKDRAEAFARQQVKDHEAITRLYTTLQQVQRAGVSAPPALPKAAILPAKTGR